MPKKTTKKSVTTKKTKTAANPKSTGTPLEVLASFEKEVPQRLKDFFQGKEFAQNEEKFVWGISGHETEKKFALVWASPKLLSALEDVEELDGVDHTNFLPFAVISKANALLAVELSAPECPVHLLDLESGYKPYAKSFDDFLSRLLNKGEASPLEALKKASEKAQELVEKDSYKKVVPLLEPLLEKFPEGSDAISYEDAREVGHAHNLLGLAYKNLGEIPKAIAQYERGCALGSKGAGLNLCDLYLEEFKDYEKLVSYAEELSKTIWAFADAYAWFHVRNYLGRGYLLTNRPIKAVFAYHQIQNYFSDDDPAKLQEAIQDLRELIKENPKADKKTGEEILLWLDVAPEKPTKERSKFLRNWWEKLPKAVQESIREKVEIAEKPTDEDLDRVTRMTSLEVNKAKLEDLSWVAPLQKLEHLTVEENEFTDLSPLEELKRLERIYVSQNKLTALTPLAKLKRITHISAAKNQLKDLSGLEHLHNLEELHAPESGITNVDALRGLPELKKVTLYHNKIDDFSPLAECPRLEDLSCFENPFSRGFAAFASLPWLETLYCGNATKEKDVIALKKKNPWIEVEFFHGDDDELPEPQRASYEELLAWWHTLTPALKKRLFPERKRARNKSNGEPPEEILREIVEEKSLQLSEEPLGSLPSMRHYVRATFVNIEEANITDLTPLAEMPRLRELIVRKNPIKELTPLSLVKNLEELYMDDCLCSALAPLQACKNMREIQAENNQIEDLTPLGALTELRELGLENNRIQSLAPLKSLRKLRKLLLGFNQITDLSPLASCENLRELEVWANPSLQGVMALAELPELDRVISHGSIPRKDREALTKARPDLVID